MHLKTDNVEVYDIKNKTWSSVASLPQKMAHAGAAQFNGKLYVVGGRTESSNSSSSWINLNTNEMYDLISDTWTSKAPMPTNRSGLTAAESADGNIYVIGGEDVFSFTVFDSNEKYDPKTDKWSPEAPMPTARLGQLVFSII